MAVSRASLGDDRMAPQPLFDVVKDEHDARDWAYAPPSTTGLPGRVDLREQLPEVFHQGTLNSCTANAMAAVLVFDERKQGLESPSVPSRLFIYYNERLDEGTAGKPQFVHGAPVQMRDCIKTVN